ANRAEAYIRTHFHEPISTSIIAEKLGCNPDYLERQYKRVYGRTITEEIHARRIHYARTLLIDDTKNIDEIAFNCGFNDPAYFRRIFKRKEGITPSAYRRLYAKMHVNTG
ncbi:MAG: helix-turn-helix transcriptional regulator, partial [Firmicutes bacterium]|nr:helix-turn-helix transcriptional regulator [Bacillota bacterium]